MEKLKGGDAVDIAPLMKNDEPGNLGNLITNGRARGYRVIEVIADHRMHRKSGWGLKISAVDMTPRLPAGCAALKKHLPPSLCGRPLTAPHRAPRGTPRTDPLTTYQSFGREPKLNL